MVVDRKSFQEYPVKAAVLQCSILGPAFVLLYIDDQMVLSVILVSMQIILLATLKCEQSSILFQQ